MSISIATMSLSILLLCGVAVTQVHAQPTPVRTADAACEQCHKKIFDNYLATPMANASGLAADLVKAGSLQQSATGVEYSISAEGSQVLLKFQQTQPPLNGKRTLDYFLGSGHLGTTYLYQINGYLLESPVAYYASSGRLDMKPGIAGSGQIAPALPVRAACLRCHMSAVQRSDPGTFNHYTGLPFLHSGITCEGCHGSAAQHVASAGRAPIVNPAKLDENKRDSVCISCHLEGDVTVERQGHKALDYRPGDSIFDYLSYFVFAGKDATIRGVSEVEQFSMSVCKRSSGAHMSCTSCHDPHFSPNTQQRVAFYRTKCLACHSSGGFAETHHADDPDCTSCHMPRTGSENIPHVAWTDHRILRLPQGQPLQNASATGELAPVLSSSATPRDLALAYYNASFNGKPKLQSKAYPLLKAHASELDGDPEALDALGTMSASQSDFDEARRVFEKVLAADATDFTAATNLGTLLARSGNLKQAIALWEPVFQRNQVIPGLAENLARAQCKLGDATGSRATLQTTLSYSPGLQRASQALAILPACEAPHN
jgi:predicted CXXCH cytochrome family protein